VVVAAFCLLRISESGRLKGDAAIALISTSALAIGVMIISMSSGMNTDVFNFLFGSILGMSGDDVILSAVLSIVVLLLFIVFYNRIFAITFDENFARATGNPAELYNMLVAILTALIIVVGMRMMGSLLISALIVFPALTAMRVCRTFKAVMVNAAAIAVVCFVVGISISYFFATPTGASIVLCDLAAFIIYSVIGLLRNVRAA